jgi:hypothetical protein
MSEEGGTKIQRRNVQQIPQQMPQMSQQQQQMMQQQMLMQQQQNQQGQQQMPQMSEQQYHQMQQQQQMQQNQGQQQMQQQIPRSILKKPKIFSLNNKNIKNSLIVVVIFILLNSKMIWRALSKVPMMGTVEPSVLALLVNSLLAGIVFYIISTKLNKTI